jgi:hypothetical protein
MAILLKNTVLYGTDIDGLGTFLNADEGVLNLTPNGSLIEYNGVINFNKFNYSSSLLITSAADLSAITFTLTGVNNGYNVVEYLQGPNANTVSSEHMFETITSISISADINDQFTLGYGDDVAIYFTSTISKVGNVRPVISTTYISPNRVGAVPANTWLFLTTVREGKILLKRTELVNETTRPVDYRILNSVSIPEATVRSGNAFTVIANVSGLQCVIRVKDNSITSPTFFSFMGNTY